MQKLAFEMNLSESTFVLPPSNPKNDARVRIFVPTYEMPFAGHPLVGTAWLIATRRGDQPLELRFEVIAGLVVVRMSYDDAGQCCGAEVTAPQALSLGGSISGAEVAIAVGLTIDDILTDSHAPMLAGVGAEFLFAEVSDASLVRSVPDLAGFRQLSNSRPALKDRLSLCLYARNGNDLHVRMFAPLAGIVEDPATGSANAALAALLLHLDGGATAEFKSRQGAEMGRPSLLSCRAFRDEAGQVRASVAGGSVPMFTGSVDLD